MRGQRFGARCASPPDRSTRLRFSSPVVVRERCVSGTTSPVLESPVLKSTGTLVVTLMLSVLVHHASAKLPTIPNHESNLPESAREAQAVPSGL